MKGIDVSKWNGSVDFKKVKASGLDFVIIRAGYGKEVSQKDPYFEENYKKAKAAGLHVGAYWYSYADSVSAAKQEAQACFNVLQGKQFDFPIYYDVEEKKQFDKGKNFIDSIITVFCNSLEAAGYYTGIYMSASPLKTHVSESVRKRFTVWVAQYNKTCTYKDPYCIWQYSSKGKIAGHKCDFDMNECYVDFAETITKGGFNGYTRNGLLSIDEVARQVLDGKWGNGDERRRRLAAAGYEYAAVQAKVNSLIKK